MAEQATTPEQGTPPTGAVPNAGAAQSQGGQAPPVDAAMSAQIAELTRTVQSLAEQSTQYRKGIQTIGERVSQLANTQPTYTPHQQQAATPSTDPFADDFGRAPQDVTPGQMRAYVDRMVAEAKESAKNEGAQLAYNAIMNDYGQAPLAANTAGRVNEYRSNQYQPLLPQAFVESHKAEVVQAMMELGTVTDQAADYFYRQIAAREQATQTVATQAQSQQQTQDATAPANATNIQGATGGPPPPDGGSGKPTWDDFAKSSFEQAMIRPE